MRKALSLIIVLLTSVSGFGALRVDLGLSNSPAVAAGWTAWEFDGTVNLAGLNTQRDFTSTMGATGTVGVTLISTPGKDVWARKDGYYGDQAFSPTTPLELWVDVLMFFGGAETPLTVKLEGLKAGQYAFTSYAGYRHVIDPDSTTKIYVNGQYSGLDATCYMRGPGQDAPAEFLETNVPKRVVFKVLNDNDTVTIEFRYPAGGPDWGINGFELDQYLGASDPYPASGQTEVGVGNLVLSWSMGQDYSDPNNPSQPNPAITKHYLYLTENEPNFPDVEPIEVTDLTDPIEYGPVTVQKDKTYYWRVDESINNSDPGDPNTIQGLVWYFETEKSLPVITKNPQDLIMGMGSTVSFITEFSGITSPTAKWYKYVDGVNDVQLSSDAKYQINTVNIGGASYRSTLDISNTAVEDEGQYYCSISNVAGTALSSLARLTIKRLMSYYPFEGTLEDTAGSYDGTYKGTGEPNYVTSAYVGLGQAMSFNGANYVDIGYGQPRDQVLRNGSVSIWFYRSNTATKNSLFGTLNSGATQTFIAEIAVGNTPITFSSRNGLGSSISWTMSKQKTIYPGTWHFYTVTWGVDSANDWLVNEYVDGLLTRTGHRFDPGVFSWQYTMMLGADSDRGPAEQFWKGYLDEVKFYNYPLSTEEIAQEYANIAGQAVCINKPIHDMTGDCKVDLNDLAILAAEWLVDGNIYPVD
ncbi:MAG: LamG-like jellyroll fold domain-containing protein [Syntrophomonas sp.]